MPQKINFYRTPIDKKLLRSLTKRSNLKGLTQSLGILFFYSLTTGISLYFFKMKMWIPMVFACYLHSVFSSFIGMESSVHELSHKTPFRTKWLNELFYGLFSFLSWNNPVHFRESHHRHHHLTVFRGLDKEVVLEPAPFGVWDYISWFIFDWKKFRMIMRGNFSFALGKDSPDIFYWDPLFEKNNPLRAKMILWARLQLAGHFILTALFIYFDLWVLIYTVSMSYFFATFLSNSCGMVQHTGLRPNIPDFRMTCHTMIFGSVTAFFYWRMNYHIEHHMYASVPFYNLHKLHKAIAYDIPIPVRGHLPGVQTILKLIRRQKNEPQWCYEPQLPKTASPARMV